jgi:hypothetical protein
MVGGGSGHPDRSLWVEDHFCAVIRPGPLEAALEIKPFWRMSPAVGSVRSPR